MFVKTKIAYVRNHPHPGSLLGLLFYFDGFSRLINTAFIQIMRMKHFKQQVKLDRWSKHYKVPHRYVTEEITISMPRAIPEF
jgi:hypothetical protein